MQWWVADATGMRQRIRDANRAAGTTADAHADANDNDRAGGAAGAVRFGRLRIERLRREENKDDSRAYSVYMCCGLD